MLNRRSLVSRLLNDGGYAAKCVALATGIACVGACSPDDPSPGTPVGTEAAPVTTRVMRELLPSGAHRSSSLGQPGGKGLAVPATLVGTTGKISVYYANSLGA